jgi:hypothetical protein
MFYSDTQSFLNFLTNLNRLEVGVFDRAVKLNTPGIFTVVYTTCLSNKYINFNWY